LLLINLFFRAHAHLDSKRREPWVFEEPWTGRMRNAIRMRYRLLPLWNLLFYKASVNGEPPMRPIWYNYPTETDTFGIETEFMVGDSLLISAVMEEGKREVETYFPPGNWFRLDDHENVYKNNMIVSAGEEEQVPTFIRGGTSFAVRDRIRRSSTLMENDPVSLIIALDESSKSSGQVYFDDGITHDYQNNEFILANIESNLSQIQYSLDESSGAFNSPAWVEKIEVYGFSKLPKEVLLTTNESSWTLLNVKLSGTTLVIRKPGVKVNAGFRIKFEF